MSSVNKHIHCCNLECAVFCSAFILSYKRTPMLQYMLNAYAIEAVLVGVKYVSEFLNISLASIQQD